MILTKNRFGRLARLLAVAVLGLAAFSGRADDQPRHARPQENRFLFLVDTASAMRSYSNEVVRAVVDLLGSDLRGELRQGDTMGLWTYNDRLHPEFPMQIWSRGRKDMITENMAIFLQAQHYAKRANFGMVMPALNQVIKHSERLTVILIFDGAEKIRGTPFDRDINELQKKYARELRAAHEPFILVLAARDGSIFDYTINYPGVVAIPHTAFAPEKPVETNAPVAAAPTPNPVTSQPPPPAPLKIGPSIIVTGPGQVYHGPMAPPPEKPVTQTTIVATTPAPAPAPPPVPVVKATAPLPPPVVATPAPTLPAVPIPAPAPPASTSVAPVVTRAAPPQPSPPAVSTVSAAPPAVKEASVPPPATELGPKIAASPAPPVQNAPVAAVAPAGGPSLVMFAAAFLLLAIAIVLVVVLLRRSRHTPQSSLISQSIDRPR